MDRVEDIDGILKPYIIKKDIMKPNRDVYIVEAKNIREIMKNLKNIYEGNVYLATIVGVDRVKENLFELNYFIHIVSLGKTIVIKTYIPRNEPKIDTILDIFPGSYEAEAEVYDLLGIEFIGNNYLRRGFFVPADVVSQNIYPLRKDAQV
ncbi:MAG: NADH-quinone oxidoreductase subunit C [Ignisphaera sp.]